MEIRNLPYYVRFIFNTDEQNGGCLSTNDIDVLRTIKYRNHNEPIDQIRIGQEITFEDNSSFRVIDIKIRHLINDTEVLNYGVDLEDCGVHSGVEKITLLSVLIKMERID